ncbi:MAG: efflux RND transporter permease subunit [Pyrinomonadaceae bacterium]
MTNEPRAPHRVINRAPSSCSSLLLCVAGLYAAYNLPTAIFPQTDFPRIVIVVDNGVVPAPQMLASVTRPIEEAMNGIPGITRIKSTTARGAADINLFLRLER